MAQAKLKGGFTISAQGRRMVDAEGRVIPAEALALLDAEIVADLTGKNSPLTADEKKRLQGATGKPAAAKSSQSAQPTDKK